MQVITGVAIAYSTHYLMTLYYYYTWLTKLFFMTQRATRSESAHNEHFGPTVGAVGPSISHLQCLFASFCSNIQSEYHPIDHQFGLK